MLHRHTFWDRERALLPKFLEWMILNRETQQRMHRAMMPMRHHNAMAITATQREAKVRRWGAVSPLNGFAVIGRGVVGT